MSRRRNRPHTASLISRPFPLTSSLLPTITSQLFFIGNNNPFREDPWQIDPGSLEILEHELLGRGAFAKVVKGRLRGTIPLLVNNATICLVLDNLKEGVCDVAVKRLPPHGDQLSIVEFLKEIDFMKQLGYHAHVIRHDLFYPLEWLVQYGRLCNQSDIPYNTAGVLSPRRSAVFSEEKQTSCVDERRRGLSHRRRDLSEDLRPTLNCLADRRWNGRRPLHPRQSSSDISPLQRMDPPGLGSPECSPHQGYGR